MNNLTIDRSWFYRFAIYNFIFLCLQFSWVFSQSNSFIHAIPLPISVCVELIETLFVHLGLYFVLAMIQVALLWGVMQYNVSTKRWHVIIWCLSIAAIITSNWYFFPLSTFSRVVVTVLPPGLLTILMLGSTLPLAALTLNTLFWVGKAATVKKTYILVIFFTVSFAVSFFIFVQDPHLNAQNHQKQTNANIILIGVDSLPPDAISLKTTPTLAKFINHSVQFKETISPLARTYPAWASILTGLYPQHHLAHYNLISPEQVKSYRSIAWTLQTLGYQTIYSTDDRRFNSLGKEFGFQQIIGPKLGVNDMLLGTFNDFPLSNLFINLSLGRWLFPYNHLNRASYFSYYPQYFDQALQNALASHDSASPLFLAVHFTLPHWPYAFASSLPAQVKNEYSMEERGQLYLTALQQADQQVAHFLHALRQYHYLDDSLIILLSDHGETLYTPGSRLTSRVTYQGHGKSKLADYFKRKTSTTLEKSAGHGSDLLSPAQYHCLLAFKIYQHKHLVTAHKIISTRVALIDIAPTILAFLGLIEHQPVDGISLLKTINHPNEHPPERGFIMESGMLPNQFLSREKARVLAQRFFTVDPRSGQLQIKKNELATLDAMKLYAIIKGDWLFALYPDDEGYLPIIQRLSDRKWMDNVTSNFAKKTPAAIMLHDLRQFYNKEWRLVSSP